MYPKAIHGFQGEYRFLSNFWPVSGGILLKGSAIFFSTVEHAYQASKTLDIETRMKIAELKTPGEAKRAGKKVKIRNDWEEVKLFVMHDLVYQKFLVPDLKKQLLLTGDAYLEETNNWKDIFWGVCNGVGHNHLGKILMNIRSEHFNSISSV